MDITQITSQGIIPYRAIEIDHGVRPNGLGYKIKFQYFLFSDITSNLTARFYVQRYFNDGTLDISYTYDAIADDNNYVDKNGDLVAIDDPNKWGSEMDYFRVLFSFGVNKSLIEDYQNKLFARGTFDKPKNPYI